MFELQVDGESGPRYAVIRGLTRKGGTGDAIHVDFYQVDPNQPISANVPIRIEGEAPAVRDLAGTLVHSLDLVSIRCTPLAIPEALIGDASILKSFEATLTVGDLQVPEGVEVLTDPSVPVASVVPPRLRVDTGEEGEEEAADEAEAAPSAV
jgi:large subunit ribosomal protein L25